MVLNATFNNISVISWRPLILVEETRVPSENHWSAASQKQTLSHNVISSTPRLRGVQTHNRHQYEICLFNLGSMVDKIYQICEDTNHYFLDCCNNSIIPLPLGGKFRKYLTISLHQKSGMGLWWELSNKKGTNVLYDNIFLNWSNGKSNCPYKIYREHTSQENFLYTFNSKSNLS